MVKGRMERNKGRGRPRVILLDDIKVSEKTYEKIVVWTENAGETWCLEPALEKNTNDHGVPLF